MNPREHVASTINGNLHRLPLVLEILDELHESNGPAKPGDEDIRYGSIRAVETMITRLERIDPAPVPVSDSASTAEQVAFEWLLGKQPSRLIPSPIIDQLTALIARLLPLTSDSIYQKTQAS
ncbi:MAG: hypothetical protein ABI600_08805 [Luteolibacter sp.]